MKAAKSSPPAKQRAFLIPILLAVILAVLFWKSFLPDYVHFSNDGPLGQQNTEWSKLPGAFTGVWGDLNDIGNNGGTAPLGLSTLMRWVLGPVGYSKFLAPFALFILGLGAWTFFRQLKLSPLAAALGALAAALNSDFFATACWGVASQQIAIGMDYFALALVVSNSPETPVLTRWARLTLAGLCVGLNVIEAADIGAIFSLCVAGFVFYKAITETNNSTAPAKIGRGVCSVLVIAIFAVFIAAESLVSLVGTQIAGIVGPAQNTETKAQHWDWATEWSEPKIETLGLFVPGLFGYKMDTPNNMMEFLQNSYQGGNYWGGIGRDPNTDRFLDGILQPGDEVTVNINTPDHPGQSAALTIGPDGSINAPELGPIQAAGLSGLKLKETIDHAYASQGIEGSVVLPGNGVMRFTGGGDYAGILVALVAAWAIAQSLRRRDSLFSTNQQRLIWFWTAMLVASLLLSFGRFGFFGGIPYRWFYELPYFSSIRNPTKFIHVFSWAMVILFAYGIHAMQRRYLDVPAGKIKSSVAQLQSWWKNIRGFDRKWTIGCGIVFIGATLAWLIYASEKANLVRYLQAVEAPGDPNQIAAFSISQTGWFLLFFAAAILLCLLIIAGVFSGPRAKFAGVLLGTLLVVDLGRADLPYINYWNYIQKYDIDPANHANSTNPILNILRDKPYEHRVAQLPFRVPDPLFNGYGGLYAIEWMQHQFPYYNIQSLDLVQRSRLPAEMEAYESVLAFRGTPETIYLIARRWQLSNTSYLLGPAGYLDVLNSQLDPLQHSFHILQRFQIVPKPGIEHPDQLSQLTAVLSDNGDYALFDYGGALPRAKLYTDWRVCTNHDDAVEHWLADMKPYLPEDAYGILTNLDALDQATLETLSATNFDPWQTVLLAKPLPTAPGTNQNPGTVEFKSYAPKDIVLSADADAPSVLLLNDRYDPNWRVTVDGEPAELLRCNFIMRGVYLTPGQHTVEFQFILLHKPLYITLAAFGVGILLCGFLIVSSRRAKLKTS